jgi:hypothetical protein
MDEVVRKQRDLAMWRLFDMGLRKSKVAYAFDVSVSEVEARIELIERSMREKREAGEPYGRQGF